MQERKNYTYVKKASGKETAKILYAGIFPMIVFFLCLITIATLKTAGKIAVAPLIGVMWIVGAACAIWMPSMRKSIINETLIFLASYCGSLIGLKMLISLSSGISAEMLMSTFGQAGTVATSNTIPGWLQNVFMIDMFMMPFGFLGMEGKRILSFRRNMNKKKVIEQLRGIRKEKE